MDRSSLPTTRRLSALAALVVTVTGLLSVTGGWGAILVLAVLAGIGTLGVIAAPKVAPRVRLPGSDGSLLVLLGVVALVAWIPPLIAWLGWIAENLTSFDTLQFLLGFACSTILAWAGFVAFRAEGGVLRLGVTAQRPPEARGTASQPDADAEP